MKDLQENSAMRTPQTHVEGMPVVWQQIDTDAPDPSIEYDTGVVRAGPYVMKWIKLHETGHSVVQHVHPHDHATIVTRGSVSVFVDGKALGAYQEGEAIMIEANKRHMIVALEPGATFWCIHFLPGE
jgi:hypothetical protein